MKNISWQHPLYYLPLLFISFPILGIFYFGYPFWTLWLTIGFVLSYLYLVHGKKDWLFHIGWTYMIVYIVYMTIFVNGGMMWFSFYFTGLLAFKFQDKFWSYRVISYALVMLGMVILGLLWSNDISIKIMIVLVPVINYSMLYYWRKEAESELQRAAILEKSQSINLLLAENERNRIGQDLHDTLGHIFAMVSVKAELAKTLLDMGKVEQAKIEVSELQSISKKAMSDIRDIVQSLKEHTVAEELVILDNMLELAGVRLSVSQSKLTDQLCPTVQGKLTMILRELVTNLIKHSKADQCQLDFSIQDKMLVLNYEDNGRGFGQLDGTELHTIKDRLVTIQGYLEVVSLVQPTNIRIWIPMEEDE